MSKFTPALRNRHRTISHCSSIHVVGIQFGTSEHKLSHDLLLYITDPHKSGSPLLQCLKDIAIISILYPFITGYKLNYTKSEILPLNTQDSNIRSLTDQLKWSTNGFKYLGIHIGKSDGQLFKNNYIKLLEQTKSDLQRWMGLPLSLIGRMNTIKMNILPKFVYLFQCLPIKIPKNFFKEINKIMTPFLWQKKIPRVKLVSLQASYSKAGLNLPNLI